ncbi:MAG: YdeI/OmpD-associated family protein [Chitinophagaceae bacterium]|nr:YdeI/OmpD-associated family protein [Chitinophagaceae bacterium]
MSGNLITDQEKEGVKTFYAASRKAWRKWLEKNHSKEKSVWLIIYRMKTGTPSVYYKEAVDEALCFGWIDSKPNKRDDKSFYQYFAKRNPKSKWSKVNKDKIARLTKEGLMTTAGLTAVELAKQTGTWTALDEVEQVIIPNDLRKLFEKNKKAWKNFEAFPRSAKRGILEWISSAKKPETRVKRIYQTVKKAALNLRASFPGQ